MDAAKTVRSREEHIAELKADNTIEKCAIAAHMVNRAYCRSIGDMSQPTWADAPDWQKESARLGVVGVLVDLNTPEESHRCWLKEKERTGWKYGAVKDPEKKEHPCFVQYENLPADQKRKDDLYVAAVHAVASVGRLTAVAIACGISEDDIGDALAWLPDAG